MTAWTQEETVWQRIPLLLMPSFPMSKSLRWTQQSFGSFVVVSNDKDSGHIYKMSYFANFLHSISFLILNRAMRNM